MSTQMETDEAIRSRVYKVGEVARILNCSPATVYRLIESGRLDVVRLGRSFRVTQAEINKFLGE